MFSPSSLRGLLWLLLTSVEPDKDCFQPLCCYAYIRVLWLPALFKADLNQTPIADPTAVSTDLPR